MARPGRCLGRQDHRRGRPGQGPGPDLAPTRGQPVGAQHRPRHAPRPGRRARRLGTGRRRHPRPLRGRPARRTATGPRPSWPDCSTGSTPGRSRPGWTVTSVPPSVPPRSRCPTRPARSTCVPPGSAPSCGRPGSAGSTRGCRCRCSTTGASCATRAASPLPGPVRHRPVLHAPSQVRIPRRVRRRRPRADAASARPPRPRAAAATAARPRPDPSDPTDPPTVSPPRWLRADQGEP